MLRRNGIPATVVRKHFEGTGPHGEPTTVELILDGEIDLIINTPYGSASGGSPRIDGYEIRTAAVHGQHPVHHHGAGARRRRAGHRGDDRAATSACARCRTGPPMRRPDRRPDACVERRLRRPQLADPVAAYHVLFDHGLTRVDPERAHQRGFRRDPGGAGRCTARAPAPSVRRRRSGRWG